MVTQRTKQDWLGEYADGWTAGNTEKILSSTGEGFQFGDPGEEKPVAKAEFEEYHRKFVETHGSFMDITGVVAYEYGGKLIAACVWAVPGVRGTGLIVVGDNGVERENVEILP